MLYTPECPTSINRAMRLSWLLLLAPACAFLAPAPPARALALGAKPAKRFGKNRKRAGGAPDDAALAERLRTAFGGDGGAGRRTPLARAYRQALKHGDVEVPAAPPPPSASERAAAAVAVIASSAATTAR